MDQHADDYDAAALEERFTRLLEAKVEGVKAILPLYQDKSYDLDGEQVVLTEEILKRAAVKYGRALEHIYAMSLCVAQEMNGDAFELEISVDETEQPTSVPEHLFLALELRRHEIPVISLAPRFVGDFEKGVDFKGDLQLFERTLKQHAWIAKEYGPYKISLHSGSDKFGVYPYIARETGQCFHVKTAGTSYLEALRTCCRVDQTLFTEIVEFSPRPFRHRPGHLSYRRHAGRHAAAAGAQRRSPGEPVSEREQRTPDSACDLWLGPDQYAFSRALV